MSSNPYAAPQANVALAEVEAPVPAQVLKKIRNAWIAAIISGCVTLVFTLVAMAGTRVLGFSAYELIDVALVFALAFGIYKKSRTCAVLMLVYFVVSKILLMLEGASTSGLATGVVFIYFYALGVVGTFQYHKLARAPR